jgi:hypothetical protein
MFTANVAGQEPDWSTPGPIEISENDKANAWLGKAGNFGPIILWEEKIDDSSTAIMYHRYLTNDPPVVLHTEAGVHYRNPQCRNTPYGVVSTSFLIFHEREYDDKTELYYLECTDDGSFSEPVPLAVEGAQNHELALSTQNDFQSFLFAAWNTDGNILVAQTMVENGIFTFGEPDTIDVGNCSQPCMNMELFLCWVKNVRGSDKVYKSNYNYSGYWVNPVELFDGEEINQLISGSESLFSALFSWTFYDDGVWKVANSNGLDTELLDFTADEPFDFGVYSMDLAIVKSDKWWGDSFFACAKNDGQFDEIFLSSSFYNLGLNQFSNLETQSRNPKFYVGETDLNGWWTYLIWEALVDGHWQLYYSKAYFVIGTIEENELRKNIHITPNPATNYIHIQNEKEADLTIEIFDLTGKRVYQGVVNEMEIEIKTIGWNGGIYFVKISDEDSTLTRKLILN